MIYSRTTKKTFYIIALGLLGLLGFTSADITSLTLTPTAQSAISGSSVTFTITGTNTTGVMYLKYILPQSASYQLMYQSSNITPINIGYINPLSPDPIFSLAAHSNFSVTITAKLLTTNRSFSPIPTLATFGTDQRVTTALTSAVAQITPIADLMITNILTGMNPSFSGDMVSYYITLQNIGSTNATGISFMSNIPITTFGTPTATFNGAPHTYNYIDYILHEFVWTGNYLNTLNAGASMIVIINTSMLQNLSLGTTFNQISRVSTASPEYTTGNNSVTATGIVQAAANVWVTKTLAPFTGYQAGDILMYTLTYGNSGGKAADNVVITDLAPAGITLPVSTFTIGTLPAGSGGTIVLTGTINTFSLSGTTFVNTANITTTSFDSVTGNNSSTVTGTVKGIANVTLDIIANNITNPALDNAPYGSGPNTMIQAVSGDIVQLTLTYANFGNIPGTNAVIALSGTQGFTQLGSYNGNIGTLALNATGTLVITGMVGPKNYISFMPTARLTYNSGVLLTDTVKIQEPFVCGDGILTRTETCDIQGNLGVLYSGQVCQNQQGMCVLVTQSIINNACINYQYANPLGGMTTGQSCSAATATLMNPTCTTMSGSTPVITSTGYTMNFTCNAANATAMTPITIDCGNGTTLAGTGTTFNGTCNYTSGFVGSNAQCKVGNDASNVACRVPVSASAGQCQSLDALDGTVLIVDDNGTAQGNFRCETTNGITGNITLDCGDGQTYSSYGSVFEHACIYTHAEIAHTHAIQCLVENMSSPACKEDIITDEATLGYCGNDIREGYEECDGESDCNTDCTIKGEEQANMVGCFGVSDQNLSLQKGEIFPFQWTLDIPTMRSQNKLIAGSTCDANTTYTQGQIPEDSIACDFAIKNSRGENVYTFTKSPCGRDNRSSDKMFDYIKGTVPSTMSYGRDYLTNFLGSSSINQQKFDNYTTGSGAPIYGEYKLVLEKVRYNYCDSNANTQEGTEINRVCQTNFTVTKPYLIQKSSFGLTPKTTTDLSIKDFYGFDLQPIVTSTQLDKIMVIDSDTYKGGSSVSTMMNTFITKYSKLAVKYSTVESEEGNTITVSKVPGQDIVVFKGVGTVVYTDGGTKTKPFTVIVDGPSIKINGTIQNTNAMFLLNKGDITFAPSADACTKTQVVKGIFVTNQGSFLASTKDLANTNTSNAWCAYGGLDVQGILIGNGIENIVQSRRSQLNDWFTTKGTSDTIIQTERRNEIFNGASVLIEYSPSLWSALPPGGTEFTKVLDVYKQ